MMKLYTISKPVIAQSVFNRTLLQCVKDGVKKCYSNDPRKITPELEPWEMLVDYKKLSPMEVQIHECHRDSVKEKQLMYIDPQTGYYVMTRLAHLERGECCGNACRHCPYGQVGVKDEKNKSKYNSAFYVDDAK